MIRHDEEIERADQASLQSMGGQDLFSPGKAVCLFRRKFWSEEKIRIVLDGLRGESSIAELCRQEGINSNLSYRWSKDFLEAGKKRLSGDTVREAHSDEVVGLRKENTNLKQAVAELVVLHR